MFANGEIPCPDHKYKPVGDGVQQCPNCLKKRYFNYETKTWHDTK